MRAGTRPGHHGTVSTPSASGGAPLATPRRLYRRPGDGWIGGVAAGIADHLGLQPRTIRWMFAAVSLAGGLGFALYGAYWIVLVPEEGSKRRLPAWIEYLIAAVLALAVGGQLTSSSPFGAVFVPTLLACLGGALIWRQVAEPDRDRWLRLGRQSLVAKRWGRLQLLGGAGLVVLGGLIIVLRSNLDTAGTTVLAFVVTVVGMAIVTGPWWMRLVVALRAERTERIRSQERAEIAAHLHDSVLQTLALIQRNAASPREVARLARGQERELRHLLYGPRVATGTLAEDLRTAAAEVEDAYAVTVDVVVVGDAPLDDRLGAAVAAAREAMVNAAKHSGRSDLSLYAEVEPEQIGIFVKDRGVGFDVERIDDSRQGVRGSIIGRIERHGGRVELRTAPGAGTEVVIRVDTPRGNRGDH